MRSQQQHQIPAKHVTSFLPRYATQSAVMRLYVVCPWRWGIFFTQFGILWK